ncbi:MAG: calycin-like domain-containing protein [Prevotellaceae bacterium]|nr:calycin-like domain-containing protein [Prevotellaceae bacterium]
MVKTLRKVMALAALAITTGAANAQEKPQIPNSDFESWATVSDTNHAPDNWNSFETGGGSMSEGFFKNFFVVQAVDRSEEVRPGSTGKYSAVIWARNAIIATAQGNLTLGRVIGGSATATDKANHNQSITSDAQFSQKLGALPKAIVAWVKFVPKAIVEDAPYARISATVHDSYDYIEYGTAETSAEDTENASHVVAHAEQNFRPATDDDGKYQWQRLEIPFSTENCTATDPAYIIVNLATNSIPGKGTPDDSLYIDDIELIYDDIQEPEPNYSEMLADSYTGVLTVAINGDKVPSTQEVINITKKEDGTIDLSLNNFKFVSDVSETGEFSYMFVGNILVTDITPTSEDGKQINISKEQNIIITEGTEPEGVQWLGPMLSQNGGIPVKINGTAEDKDLNLGIDIEFEMMPGLSMQIHVDFTTDTENAIATVRPATTYGYKVYTLSGTCVASGAGKANLTSLPKGIYIVENNGVRTKVLNK